MVRAPTEPQEVVGTLGCFFPHTLFESHDIKAAHGIAGGTSASFRGCGGALAGLQPDVALQGLKGRPEGQKDGKGVVGRSNSSLLECHGCLDDLVLQCSTLWGICLSYAYAIIKIMFVGAKLA